MWEHQLQLFLPFFRFVKGPRLLKFSKEVKCCPLRSECKDFLTEEIHFSIQWDVFTQV